MTSWPFQELPNTATITNACVLSGAHPLRLVTHDSDDGSWQFLCGEAHELEEARVVSLRSILEIIPNVAELADLPPGWRAWRAEVGESWQRSKKPRLLSEAEFRSTLRAGMLDITSREDDVYPEGVIDIETYLAAIHKDDLQGMTLIPAAPPANVYLSGDGRFTHVLYRCDRSNVYLVVVIQMDPDDVFGHYVLDLGAEYGIRS